MTIIQSLSSIISITGNLRGRVGILLLLLNCFDQKYPGSSKAINPSEVCIPHRVYVILKRFLIINQLSFKHPCYGSPAQISSSTIRWLKIKKPPSMSLCMDIGCNMNLVWKHKSIAGCYFWLIAAIKSERMTLGIHPKKLCSKILYLPIYLRVSFIGLNMAFEEVGIGLCY